VCNALRDGRGRPLSSNENSSATLTAHGGYPHSAIISLAVKAYRTPMRPSFGYYPIRPSREAGPLAKGYPSFLRKTEHSTISNPMPGALSTAGQPTMDASGNDMLQN
jgi:hypothetical protein